MRIQLPIVSFLCLVLVLLPLPWHWRTRNVSTISIVVWLALINLIRGVNSIVWAGSTVVKYPVWCDITTKLIMGSNIALPAATLCLCRHLATIASPRHTMATASDKRRRTIFEIVMIVVLPIIGMALHYVVQGHRFDILEDFGCNPTTYVSVAALFIVYLPPLVLSLGTLVYAGIALRWFVHRRAQFQNVLRDNQSSLTTGRYLRLIGLAITEMLFATSMSVFVLVITLQEGLRPWISWEDVHSDWLRIAQFARIIVPDFFWHRLLITWYIIPVCSIVFFAFFGVGQEAQAEYLRYWGWIKRRVFRIQPKPRSVLPTASGASRGINTLSSVGAVPTIIQFQSEIASDAEKWSNATPSTSRPQSLHSSDKPGALEEQR